MIPRTCNEIRYGINMCETFPLTDFYGCFLWRSTKSTNSFEHFSIETYGDPPFTESQSIQSLVGDLESSEVKQLDTMSPCLCENHTGGCPNMGPKNLQCGPPQL